MLHKFASAFGSQDIDFPESPSFSRLYLLRSEDERAIRAVFVQEVLRYFERHPDLYVEARSRGLIVYRSGKRMRPSELPQFLAQAREVYELFAGGHTNQPDAADLSLTPDIEDNFEGIMRNGIDRGAATPTVVSPNEAIMTGSAVGVGIHHLYANRHSYDGASTKGTRVFDCLLLKGRTSRSKWWLWWLAVLSACYGPSIIVSFVYYNTVVERAADQTNPLLDFSGFPSFLIGVMVVVAGLVLVGAWLLIAASVRRLHDMNRAGSWLLIILLPYLGLIILLIWLGFFPPRPQGGSNRYGVLLK